MNVSQYPGTLLEEGVKVNDQLKRVLPGYEIGWDSKHAFTIKPKNRSLCAGALHSGLKLVVFRRLGRDEDKQNIRNALEPLGYRIAEKEFTEESELGSKVFNAVSLARACSLYSIKLPHNIEELLDSYWDNTACFMEEQGMYPSPLDNFFSVEHIFLEEIIAREGIVNESTRKLLNQILPYNPDIQTYHFVIYSPNRLATNSDDVILVPNAPFEVIAVPNNDGVDIEILDDEIKKRNLTPDFAVGLASKVIMSDGRVMHIPMIDFKECASGDDATDTIAFFGLGPAAEVLSGNGDHVFGTKLKTPEEWEEFNKRLCDDPDVGGNYPALQVEQGFSLLRITPCAAKPYYPLLSDIVSGITLFGEGKVYYSPRVWEAEFAKGMNALRAMADTGELVSLPLLDLGPGRAAMEIVLKFLGWKPEKSGWAGLKDFGKHIRQWQEENKKR